MLTDTSRGVSKTCGFISFVLAPTVAVSSSADSIIKLQQLPVTSYTVPNRFLDGLPLLAVVMRTCKQTVAEGLTCRPPATNYHVHREIPD